MGQDVLLDNGVTIKSSDVVSESLKGRVVAILQDTSESLEAEVLNTTVSFLALQYLNTTVSFRRTYQVIFVKVEGSFWSTRLPTSVAYKRNVWLLATLPLVNLHSKRVKSPELHSKRVYIEQACHFRYGWRRCETC